MARLRTIRAGLSVCLALAFGLSPFLLVAHVAFGDHDHRYCPEHQQLEDIPRSRSDRWPPSENEAIRRTAPAWSDAASIPAPQRHIACSVLNHSLSRNPLDLPDSTCAIAQPDLLTSSPLRQSGEFGLCSLLHCAPKTSPPPVAA